MSGDWRDRRAEYLTRTGRKDQLAAEMRGYPDYAPPKAAKRAFRLKSPKPPRLGEDDVEEHCLHLLARRGWLAHRNHSGTFKSVDGRRWIKGHRKGTPDYTCIKGRTVFMLETKRPGEQLSPDQEACHKELRQRYHVEIATVDSVEALDAWLAKFLAVEAANT